MSTWNSELDLVVGGVPCPGFSAIGKRHPNDPRNLLAFSFLNIVTTLKPRYFLMENVQGMTSFVDPEGDGDERLLARLIANFEQADTVLKPAVLNASAFGVPQDRKRLILIGCRKSQPLAKYPLPTCLPVTERAGDTPRIGEAGHEKSPSDKSTGPTVSDALGDLPWL